ncbi:MAG TPA: orotidine-5'-phosphate decarboxylase [Haliangiales bacterium]|nr:orotidine-5'-phosphate decarboxylase [Haliangiales bacterium]
MTGNRLIVALDVEDAAAAEALLAKLAGVVTRVKVGLELYTAEGPELVRRLVGRGLDVMLDLKLHDIPETVARATSRAAELGVDLLTVHVAGGTKMMQAAVGAAAGRTRILGVTVLTSLTSRDLAEVAIEPSVEEVVVRRATLAMEAGLDGVVASPLEAARIRAAAPEDFLIVTPGVRPAASTADDQARVATPAAARAAGADLVVVGRPIRDAADPRAAAEAILRELA